MSPVNIKSSNKPSPPANSGWHKVTVTFPNDEDCRTFSIMLALDLREAFPVYFARYCDAVSSRAVYQVHTSNPAHLKQFVKTGPFKECLQKAKAKMGAIEPCSGSKAHAAAFDTVGCILQKHLEDMKQEPSKEKGTPVDRLRFLAGDVIHWICNMAGLDYAEEAKLYLTGVWNINTIYDASIQAGRKLAKSRKAGSSN